ncbi:MAG: hypothetical protein GEV10_27825 [Streptosporangiales bacterium]|nr:hypothetical protein [Streptosporangiales bacterium]
MPLSEAGFRPFAAAGVPVSFVAISPHLDDAVMSVGATLHALARAGHEVIVATVFAGDPPPEISKVARQFHLECGLPDDQAMALRREEDRRALTALGCQPLHLDLRDAIYRRDQSGGWQCRHDRAMFDDNPPAEPDVESLSLDLVREIVDSVAGRGSVGGLLTCAGIGGHIDHRLTTRAVTKIGAGRHIPILRWEDLPYACGTDPIAATDSPTTILSAPDQIDWRAKATAVQCYTSQLDMLWPQQESGWSALLEHGQARGKQAPVEIWWRG